MNNVVCKVIINWVIVQITNSERDQVLCKILYNLEEKYWYIKRYVDTLILSPWYTFFANIIISF